MSALAGLFNKAAGVAATAPASQVPAKSGGFKIGAGSGDASGPAVEQGEKGETPVGAATVETSPPPANAAAAGGFGGFKIGAGSTPRLPAPVQESATPASDGAQSGVPTPAASSDPAPTVQFADQTPATAPQRDLPADVSAEVKRFVENLDHLHSLTPEPELASSAIRNIMIELKRQPQYMRHVSDDDVRVMIQMMRETMGLTRATKEKKVAKRTAKTSAALQTVMDELADLDDLG